MQPEGYTCPVCTGGSKQEEIVRALFPAHPLLKLAARYGEVSIEPFSEEEVTIESLISGKVPCGDRVCPEAVKALHPVELELLKDIFLRCAERGQFAQAWKEARALIIQLFQRQFGIRKRIVLQEGVCPTDHV